MDHDDQLPFDILERSDVLEVRVAAVDVVTAQATPMRIVISPHRVTLSHFDTLVPVHRDTPSDKAKTPTPRGVLSIMTSAAVTAIILTAGLTGIRTIATAASAPTLPLSPHAVTAPGPDQWTEVPSPATPAPRARGASPQRATVMTANATR